MGRLIPSTIRTLFEVVYPDSIESIESLINKLCPDEWSYILHDKDILESGELKKPHYHLFCKWYTPRNYKWVANIMNYSSNYILRTAKNKRACHQYMLHITADCKTMKKHIYERDELHSNISDLKALIADDREIKKDNFNEIFNLIQKLKSEEITYDEFSIMLNDKFLLETFNKYYNSVFRRMIPGYTH